MFERLGTHPNVGAVLLVSLGCEGFDRRRLREFIAASGRRVETVVIQKTGGTAGAIAAGAAWLEATLPTLAAMPTVPMLPSELVVGTVCGGSDGTSGLTANPAIGKAAIRVMSGTASSTRLRICWADATVVRRTPGRLLRATGVARRRSPAGTARPDRTGHRDGRPAKDAR